MMKPSSDLPAAGGVTCLSNVMLHGIRCLPGDSIPPGAWEAVPDGTGISLLIGEGVATTLSAREAAGHPVIAALCCRNLSAVAREMRERYPAADLVILADLVKDTGKLDPHAVEAAREVRGRLAVPEFGENRDPSWTDLNDLANHRGQDAVRECIANAKAPDIESTAENLDGTVRRLAALSPVEYDRAREAEAKRLGIRLSTLDAEVMKARAAMDPSGGKKGQGQAVVFPALEPWPDPVDGAALLTDLAGTIRRYAVLPKHADTAIALWISFSCAHSADPDVHVTGAAVRQVYGPRAAPAPGASALAVL